MSENEKKVQMGGEKLSIAKKLMFGAGMGGYNIMWYWINSFLMIFYTDTIGVPMASITALMFVVRIFDAINDPIIGSFMDRRQSRWGRYRHFVFLGACLMMLFICMVFGAQADWAPTTKVVWMWVTYTLATVGSTVQFMAYGSLQGVLTSDAQERSSISLWRMICTGIGNMAAGYIGIYLLVFFSGGGEERTSSGYFWAVFICCCFGVLANFLTFIGTKEKILPSPSQMKIPMKTTFQCLFCNWPMLIVLVGMICNGLMNYGRLSVQQYYLTYVVGNANLAATIGLVGGFGTLLGGPVARFIHRLTRHKGRAIMIVLALFSLNQILVLNCPYGWHVPIILLLSLDMVWSGALGTMMYAMTGDVADYTQLKFGVRVDGLISSSSSFGMKVGGAISPAIASAMLASAGFVANQQQTQQVVDTIMFNLAMFPLIISVAAIILLAFYKISDKEQANIIQKLKEKGMLNIAK